MSLVPTPEQDEFNKLFLLPNEEDFVRVPKEELKKLEEARVQLYKLLSHFPDDLWFTVALLEISNQMWRVANTKIWYGEKNERIKEEDQNHFT